MTHLAHCHRSENHGEPITRCCGDGRGVSQTHNEVTTRQPGTSPISPFFFISQALSRP